MDIGLSTGEPTPATAWALSLVAIPTGAVAAACASAGCRIGLPGRSAAAAAIATASAGEPAGDPGRRAAGTAAKPKLFQTPEGLTSSRAAAGQCPGSPGGRRFAGGLLAGAGRAVAVPSAARPPVALGDTEGSFSAAPPGRSAGAKWRGRRAVPAAGGGSRTMASVSSGVIPGSGFGCLATAPGTCTGGGGDGRRGGGWDRPPTTAGSGCRA